MQTSNFIFVAQYNKALAQMLTDAGRYLADDSCCFLLKIRLALELWCHDFADLHGIVLLLETTLCEKLELLSQQKVFPEALLQQLMQLRQHTNQAVHIQRDARGRHITMQPLERGQQISILQCMFDLACYTARFHNAEFAAPLWQAYPKLNLRTVLEAAMAQDGDACAQIARQVLALSSANRLLKPAARNAQKQSVQPQLQHNDLVYWLTRGLQLGSSDALEFLTELAFAKTHADIDLPLLLTWLKRFQQLQPGAALDELTGRVFERQQQLEKALQHYDKAAKAGHHGAIKRLLDYWGNRCHDQLNHYLTIGIQFNEPHALLTRMAILVANISLDAEQHQREPELLKQLKTYWVKARGMGIPGLGYIEGMCKQLGILGFTQNTQGAADLVLLHYRKVPAYCKAAVNTFNVLLAAERFAELVQVAPSALAQLDEQKDRQHLAEMEFDIALALLKLHNQKTPLAFSKTPKQLLQSAARRGYAAAPLMLSTEQKQTFSGGKRMAPKAQAVPGWVQKLALRGGVAVRQ
ncbi:hypothetical protein ACFO3I_03140 [Rheinheimera marina]|uniref:Sel1 repeat family protein n=1 Tax=Rheinheimera marina TaxID=1774958 RepID=A0ABV9JH76_9GAMM